MTQPQMAKKICELCPNKEELGLICLKCHRIAIAQTRQDTLKEVREWIINNSYLTKMGGWYKEFDKRFKNGKR